MYARTRTTTIATILAFGAAGMLLIPGSDSDAPRPDEAPQAAEIPAFFDDLNRGADQLLATSAVNLSSSVAPDADPVRERRVAAISPAPIVSATAASAEEPAPVPQTVLRTDSIATAVNLRSGPSSGTDRLDTLEAGASVSVLSESGGWVEVALADGRSGWVYGSYLTSADPRPVADPTPARAPEARATIQGGDGDELAGRTARIGSRLLAYDAPSGEAIFTLRPGTRVRILEQRRGWLLVSTPQGSAWIPAS